MFGEVDDSSGRNPKVVRRRDVPDASSCKGFASAAERVVGAGNGNPRLPPARYIRAVGRFCFVVAVALSREERLRLAGMRERGNVATV